MVAKVRFSRRFPAILRRTGSAISWNAWTRSCDGNVTVKPPTIFVVRLPRELLPSDSLLNSSYLLDRSKNRKVDDTTFGFAVAAITD